MNPRTCSLKSPLAVIKLAVLLIFSINHSGLGQYKSNAPFTALIRHADSSNAADLNKRLISIPEYDKAFDAYFKNKNPRKKGSGYKQYLRWRNYWSYFTENGIIKSPQTLYKAYQNKIESERPESAIANWSALGPFSAAVKNDQVPGIGRLNQVAVDPTNSNVWYVGAPAGGLWKSTDAGLSWVPIFDQYPQIGVSGIAIDPVDSSIIYIATGDDDALESYSIGVMKSTDGGQTFTETGLNVENINRGTALNEIFIDPEDRNTIWVAGTQGLYKSINAAQTFTKVIDDEVTDFRLKPGDSKTIYALSTTTFYRSTNGGTTFSRNTTNPASILPRSYMRGVMDVSPANREVLYLLYAKSSDGSLEGLYRSTDSGVNFTKMSVTVREQKTGSDGNPFTQITPNYNIMESNQAWFDLAIAVDPENANILYAGCLNIWKSSDGGNSFNKLNNWYDSNEAYTHADIHTMKFFDGALFAATDGGLYRSTDWGASFIDYSNNGIATGQFYRLDIGRNDASVMVGGTQDNSGFIRTENNWFLYTGGDGMDYEIDPLNNDLSYGFAQGGSFLFISTSKGDNLALIEGPYSENGNWITPLTITLNGEVLAGYRSVYVLGSSGFTERSEPLAQGNIDDLEASPSDPNIVWAAVRATLYLSEDAGRTFSEITTLLAPVSDISINSNNPKEVFVTTSSRVDIAYVDQPQNPSVWRINATDKTAIDKQDLTADLPTDQVYFSIIHQPRDPNNSLFVGTNLGVYRTDDSQTGWELYGSNLPNTAVSDLEISVEDAIIAASTYGRGVFTSPIAVEKADFDIGISQLSVLNPKIFKPAEAQFEAQLKNEGSQPIENVSVALTYNGLAHETLNQTVNLAPNASATISLGGLPETYLGIVSAAAEVSTLDDAWSDNNLSSTKLVVQPEAVFNETYPSIDFESSDSGLLAYDNLFGTGSWQVAALNQKFLGQTDSQVAMTGVAQNYPDMERSYLLSDFYNLSLLEQPALSLDMAFELETNWDLVYVQYSTDQGLTWQVLGSVNSTPKWYNSSRSAQSNQNDCYNCVGAQWTGEEPAYAQMTTYQYDFIANASIDTIDLSDQTDILFRVVFHSDESVNAKGVAIDNFKVFDLAYVEPPVEGNPEEPTEPNEPETEQPITIPANAFDLVAIDANCPDSTNGQIEMALLSAAPAGNYTVTLYDADQTIAGGPQNLSLNGLRFENLIAGSYTVCVTTDLSASFSRCYNVAIGQPQPLSVQSFVNSQRNELTLNLSGSDTFTIEFNGQRLTTRERTVVLNLDRIENRIWVSTEEGCQGVFEKTYILSDQNFIYPNPVSDGVIQLYLGQSRSTKVRLSLHDTNGVLEFEKEQALVDQKTQLNVKGLTPGLYFLSITDEAVAETTTHKVIIR